MTSWRSLNKAAFVSTRWQDKWQATSAARAIQLCICIAASKVFIFCKGSYHIFCLQISFNQLSLWACEMQLVFQYLIQLLTLPRLGSGSDEMHFPSDLPFSNCFYCFESRKDCNYKAGKDKNICNNWSNKWRYKSSSTVHLHCKQGFLFCSREVTIFFCLWSNFNQLLVPLWACGMQLVFWLWACGMQLVFWYISNLARGPYSQECCRFEV